MAPNPLKTWHKVVLGVGAGVALGAVVGGIVLWARPARAAPVEGLSEDEAVARAFDELGRQATTRRLAEAAYSMAYPEGPLPPTGDYVGAWDRIVAKIQDRLLRGDEPAPAPPSEPTDLDDSAERVAAWVGSLSASQRSQAREQIGAEFWDPTVRAAERGNDQATRAGLEKIKRAIEGQLETSKFAALATYANLRSTLGQDKLNEFMEIMDDTVGLPAMNPAPNPQTGSFWGLWRPTGPSLRRQRLGA